MISSSRLSSLLGLLLLQGVDRGVFSGAAAGLRIHGGGRVAEAMAHAGTLRQGNHAARVTEETLFDLASLTKPLATLCTTLAAAEQGLLDLDEATGALLTGCGGALARTPLWMLLAHASGLPAYRELFRAFPPRPGAHIRQELAQRVMDTELEAAPGARCLYSDLGYILVGAALEERLGMRLDRAFARMVARPLGVEKEVFFLPLDGPAPGRPVAATEDCPWRGMVMQGQVHDEHAWLMGGVAGHAGLFGSLEGVMSLCAHLLDLLRGRCRARIFSRALMRRAATPPWPERTWTMGFDRPSPGASSGGRYMGTTALGHLGYTGTSLWLDPQRDVVMVLLTNRVHPSRENRKIREFRPWFHDRCGEWLDGGDGRVS